MSFILSSILSGKTSGLNDNLKMQDGELYFIKVHAINQLDQVLIKRSDGVTIRENPLRPGHIADGDFNGVDLMYLPSTSTVSANWYGFGEDVQKSMVEVLTGRSLILGHV
jgi:hypothetical protein